MHIALKIGKGLLKFIWRAIKLSILIADAAFKSEIRKKPVCGEFEAHIRLEQGTITHDEFQTAINKK